MDPIPTYHEKLDQLVQILSDNRSLGLILLDASPFGVIEEQYGSETYEEVRGRAITLLADHWGKQFRSVDLLTLDEPRGLRFVLFLQKKRNQNRPLIPEDVKAMSARLKTSLLPSLARASFPYMKSPPRIGLGRGLAIYNPLVHPDRILRRAYQDAVAQEALQRQIEEVQVREDLQDLLLQEKIITAYQPIVRLNDLGIMGFEALSRGMPGTLLESPLTLFAAAEEHNYLVELDRLCRNRALLSSDKIPAHAKIFINTLPATIRDPQFRGKPLIQFLERASVAPDRIVIEITESLVIENYGLFQEAMAYFRDLGMAFAVDDVGTGYSGLEAIARLTPAFLKIDTVLVRDLHLSLINREMVGAIISVGKGIGARVIAEGIQTDEESRALESLGVEYGQGFALGRPKPAMD